MLKYLVFHKNINNNYIIASIKFIMNNVVIFNYNLLIMKIVKFV